MSQNLEFYLNKLQEAGLKKTPIRLALLSVLAGQHKLMTIDELLQATNQMTKKQNDWSTIFRCMKKFLEANIVTSTNFDDNVTRFELVHKNHHHHHIICKICQNITPLHACEVQKIEKNIKKMGFKNIDHKLEFFGTCPNCQ